MRPNYTKPCMFYIETDAKQSGSIIIIYPNGKAERMYLNTRETPEEPFILSRLSTKYPKDTVKAFREVCKVVDFLGTL